MTVRSRPCRAVLFAAIAFVSVSDDLRAAGQPQMPVLIEGTLEVVVSDDFSRDQANYDYALLTPRGERVRLDFAGSSPDAPAGSQIEVHGWFGTSALRVQEVRTVRRSAPALSALAAGPRKMAVFLFNFPAHPTEPWTAEEIRSRIFTAPNSVNAFYQEQSAGQIAFLGKVRPDGDVFGWYTVPHGVGCGYPEWTMAARAAAEAAGNDLTGYDHYLYIWAPIDYRCPFAGRAFLSGSESYINGNPTVPNMAHELGHNLGALHASSLLCIGTAGEPVAVSDTCFPNEYGDPVDVMGKSRRHMNNWHKGKLGLLAGDTQTAAADGTFLLAPSEEPLMGEIQAIRIPRDRAPDGSVLDYYWLDFRQPFGIYFDDFASTDPSVNGVAVRIAPDVSGFSNSYLLDTTPVSEDFIGDFPIPVGGLFEDTRRGITVTTLDVSPLGASVAVTVAPDTAAPLAPANLRAAAVNAFEVYLLWTPATDNIVVARYRVFKDGFEIGSESVAAFIDATVSPEATYSYQVMAEDWVGNVSAASDVAVVTMPSLLPTVAISSPLDFQALPPSGRARIRAIIEGDVPLTRAEIVVDGVPVFARTYRIPRTSRSIRRWTTLSDSLSGLHTIQIRVYDSTGRLGLRTVRVFTF